MLVLMMNKKTYSKSNGEAALRRALMRVKPEYFSWSREEQEQYGVKLPDREDFLIRQALYKTLFDIDVPTAEDLEIVSDNFSHAEILQINSAILPLCGNGENYFFLNEWMTKTLLDFETLHDYCYDDHLFQEEAKEKYFDDYKPRPYRGEIYGTWARLYIDGSFYYSSLWSVADYLMSAIDEICSAKINELIPYEFVPEKNHGKREGKGSVYNMEHDAGGLEGQLEELQGYSYEYIGKRHTELSAVLDREASKTSYIIEESTEDEPHINFVFSDKTALKSIRFRSFMRDCRNIAGNNAELSRRLEEEKKATVEYLEKQYHHIMKNFDTKIVKLRRKRKVIIADGALEGLN